MSLGQRLFAVLGLMAWVGCASSGGIVDHSFSFNAVQDSPDIEVLDYRYGTSRQPGASNPDHMRAQGKAHQGTGVTGPMVRGEFLYVKWKIKSTGAVHEDNVDLRHRLPADLTAKRVYFIVQGTQLHVYLISDERRPPGSPAIGPRMYRDFTTVQIYPDLPKS